MSFEALADELARCRPWLEAALERSGFDMDFDEIVDRTLHEDFDLWPGESSVIVTETAGDRLNLWLAAGDLEELEYMMRSIDTWAREIGFHQILLFARRGWERTFLRDHGYAPRWTVMEKTLWAE